MVRISGVGGSDERPLIDVEAMEPARRPIEDELISPRICGYPNRQTWGATPLLEGCNDRTQRTCRYESALLDEDSQLLENCDRQPRSAAKP
jgi:hypothetical protein